MISASLKSLFFIAIVLLPVSLRAQPLVYALCSGDQATARQLLKHHPRLMNAGIESLGQHRPTPLAYAADRGDAGMVKMLLNIGARVNLRDLAGRTALHYARNAAIARLLIAHRAKVDACDNLSETPLFIAAGKARLKVVRVLLAHGANPNIANLWRQTPMAPAAEFKNSAMLKLMVAHGGRLLPQGTGNTSLMFWATSAGTDYGDREPHVGTVRYLLAHGLTVRDTSSDGTTPLHGTFSGTIATMLIARGAEIEHRNREGATPLTNIAGDPRPVWNGALKALLDHGADIGARDNKGRTALHRAVLATSTCGVELLLDYNAYPDARDTFGQTPLFYCSGFDYGIIALLAEHHASLDARDNAGSTFLHYMAKKGDTIISASLLNHGADVNVQDSAGRTPLHHAVAVAEASLVRLLLAHGARTDLADHSGITPMMLAESNADIYRKHPPDSELLRYYQARANAVLQALTNRGQ